MRASAVLVAAAAALLVGLAAALAPVDDLVAKALRDRQAINVLVHFPPRQRADKSVLAKLTRPQKQLLIYKELLDVASRSQDELRRSVAARGFDATTIWLGNVMYIKQATPELIRELRSYRNVTEIEAEKEVARIHEPMVHEVYDALPPRHKNERAEWNIEIIGAPQVWDITMGNDVTLGNIDTGVRFTHQSLVRRYRGTLGDGRYNHDYNWFDPNGQVVPFDNNGHGTHTMGTIVGDNLVSGIGVAPEALWIAAKGCAASSCSNIDLTRSFQFMFAPTRQDGTNADPTLAPAVVSNSWGGGQASSTFLPYIEPLVESGTVVTFSQGNSGSGCSTANSPGDLDIVIGVGSTNVLDQLSTFSSRGPSLVQTSPFNRQKPDVAAPGERVLSSYYTSDTAYATLSGTSMACPAVTGLVGLLLELDPSLEVDDVRDILDNTSTQRVGAPNGGLNTCGGVAYTSFPNFHYGYGRIDAVAAVGAVMERKKKL